jgi:Na+-driven multidrug efflux pump
LLFILFFADQIPILFSKDVAVNTQTPAALKYVFAALPVVGIQLIGAAYFQAIGKALPALLLTLSRQGLIFIPLLFLFSNYYGVNGVWLAFPVADIISTVVTAYFLNREVRKELFD